jgi:hypothetical protein
VPQSTDAAGEPRHDLVVLRDMGSKPGPRKTSDPQPRMKEPTMKTNTKVNNFGIGRILTDAELQSVSGGETKAQAVAHANDVANAMIAILKKNGVI